MTQSPDNSSALEGITGEWEGNAALDGTFMYGFESCDVTFFLNVFIDKFFFFEIFIHMRQRLKGKFKYVPP